MISNKMAASVLKWILMIVVMLGIVILDFWFPEIRPIHYFGCLCLGYYVRKIFDFIFDTKE